MNHMPKYIEKAETQTLPLVVLRGVVTFPGMTVNCDVPADSFHSAAAAQSAATVGETVLLASLLDISEPDSGEPTLTKLCPVGTIGRIKQLIRTPDGETRLIAEGLCRATISSVTPLDSHTIATVIAKTVVTQDDGGVEGEAYLREANLALRQVVRFIPAVAEDIMTHVSTIKNPGLYADFVAANILIRYEDKQAILECFDPMVRIDTLILIMRHEADVLSCESDIRKRVRDRINRSQREYFLREEIKVIQDELGEGGSDTDAYFQKIMKAGLPAEVQKKLLKENERLAALPFGSAEASVLTNYLDVCLDIPWKKQTVDRVNIEAARKVLDADHDGVEKVKERILEYLAVQKKTKSVNGPILCLVGPPGVGKTSLGESIARATGRKFVRASLGGMRDEAEIRGHRRTYVGSMPGKIIQSMKKVKTRNPLFLLDEIDKLGADWRGDPSSALLEVLDPAQNSTFSDHYLEVDYDLSDVMFITTANSLKMPRPLLDRMEIIRIAGYTEDEKVEIAKRHLIKKQREAAGLSEKEWSISDEALRTLIRLYTRESGVRSLDRALAGLTRKAAKELMTTNKKSVAVTERNLKKYAGIPVYTYGVAEKQDQVGVTTGLAWTEVGGEILSIEAVMMPGHGRVTQTGQLGDVMKESIAAARSFVRSHAVQFGIRPDLFDKRDIHIHVPEGATPKDGPSAGIAMCTSLVSAMTGIPVSKDIAMTGEITLLGKVLPIGGLKEKLLAALRAGIKTVLIPQENEKDLEEIPDNVKKGMEIIPVSNAEEVLKRALIRPLIPIEWNEEEEENKAKAKQALMGQEDDADESIRCH